MASEILNPIGYLQEFVQKYKVVNPPKYEEFKITGPDHCKEFTYKCTFDGFETIASGSTKQIAKNEVAKKMVSLLFENGYFNQRMPVTNQNGTSQHLKNPISLLMEHCQKKASSFPVFFDGTSLGGGFLCECTLGGEKTFGQGSSKKSAKTEAAINMCYRLNILARNEETGNEEIDNCKFKEDLNNMENPPFAPHVVINSKSYINQLQEFCVLKDLPTPVYSNTGVHNNLFSVSCKVGDVNCDGRTTRKKDAKEQAALNVFKKLQEICPNGSSVVPDLSNVPLVGSNVLPDHKDSQHVLEEFNLDSDSEIEDGLEDVKTPLKNLSLNDSGIDTETSSKKIAELEVDTNGPDSQLTLETQKRDPTKNNHE